MMAVVQIGWCRHCLSEAELTFEHLPPRSARNKGWVKERPARFDLVPQQILGQWMEGHGRWALCDTCQHNPPDWKYPEEYKKWRERIVPQLESWVAMNGPAVAQGTLIPVTLDYDLMPGRLTRMVIGMLLSTQDDPTVAHANPELRKAIGAGVERGSEPPEGSTIGDWRLLLALADENWGFTTSAVPAPGSGEVLSFVDAPFVFYLYRGDPAALHESDATDVTDWVGWGHNARFDGPRKRRAAVSLPFRFNAYDFAEFDYMLLLGALHGVQQGLLDGRTAPELLRIQQMGLIVADGAKWKLTDPGVEVFTTAPVLHDRLRRKLS